MILNTNTNTIYISENNLHLVFNKILGYLPQEVGFQEWRTVDHALSTFGKLSGLKSNHLEIRIKEVLDLVSLPDVRYEKITHLSGGMKQKLLFAQAMLHEPEILILDEPMSGLDPTSRFQMKEIIQDLAKTGVTIFLSSHILSDVQDFSTQIGILNKGKLLKSGSPSEIQQDFQVENNLEIEFTKRTSLSKDVEDLPCVNSVKQISDNKQLMFIKSEADLDVCIKSILEKVLQQNCKIRNFNVLRPSLEEVYLKYIRGEVV